MKRYLGDLGLTEGGILAYLSIFLFILCVPVLLIDVVKLNLIAGVFGLVALSQSFCAWLLARFRCTIIRRSTSVKSTFFVAPIVMFLIVTCYLIIVSINFLSTR